MDMGYARGLGDRPLGVPPASPLTTIASPRLSMTYGGGSGRRVERVDDLYLVVHGEDRERASAAHDRWG